MEFSPSWHSGKMCLPNLLACQGGRVAAPQSFYRVNVFAVHPGGCYTCRHFGHRVDVAVWCALPGGEHHRSQADCGCAFWQREPGADDELVAPSRFPVVPLWS